MVVINQPGGSGSIGTKGVLDAARDGYTLASGAAKDLGTYAVSGLLDTRIEDWHLYLAVANQTVVSVNPDTPYESFDQLVAGDEGQAGGDHRGDRRRQLVGLFRHRGGRAAGGRHLQARQLRRRQPGGHRDRRGRDPGHHPARRRAGGHDPRRAAAAARGGLRPAAGARGCGPHPADHPVVSGL